MFRNQYDSDVTVWSPQGRLHQVEYAMEAVKLGSATVGLKSRDYAVLVALKRASSELASFQKKIIPIDDHLGISIAGITADARVLSRYMRQECLNYKFSFDTTYPVARLISNLGNRMQTCTQRYDRRPYGVGLLVAGYDDQGPQIFEVVPSANYFSCKAMSIGSRSQSARTYLEKHLNSFVDCSKEELIKHGLEALKGTLPNEDLLTNSNISIAVVGKNEKFHILDDEENARYVAAVEKRSGPPPDNDDGGSGAVGGNEPPTIDDFDVPHEQDSGDPQVQVAMET
ncbi:proteasome subunit alpha type-1 [Contarinia nasturtii]|uniref:proteasome subunit alpha type-1 n=1 Tax=Contarinia nasturtii TaxID=265458 RepID=UPI0012D39DC3|nr:proteasome subunit alpha type-1 [Contarinia nasturtii]